MSDVFSKSEPIVLWKSFANAEEVEETNIPMQIGSSQAVSWYQLSWSMKPYHDLDFVFIWQKPTTFGASSNLPNGWTKESALEELMRAMKELSLEQARDIIGTALEHASSYSGGSTHHNSKRPLTWNGQVNSKLWNMVKRNWLIVCNRAIVKIFNLNGFKRELQEFLMFWVTDIVDIELSPGLFVSPIWLGIGRFEQTFMTRLPTATQFNYTSWFWGSTTTGTWSVSDATTTNLNRIGGWRCQGWAMLLPTGIGGLSTTMEWSRKTTFLAHFSRMIHMNPTIVQFFWLWWMHILCFWILVKISILHLQ